MTYKLVSHESGKYTVEFDNGGCRPATDVEVALFKQRDELLAALQRIAAYDITDPEWDAISMKRTALHAIARVKESK